MTNINKRYGNQVEVNYDNKDTTAIGGFPSCDEAMRFMRRIEIFKHKSNMCIQLGKLVSEGKIKELVVSRELDDQLYDMSCFLESSLDEAKKRYDTSDYKTLIKCFTNEMVEQLGEYL